MLAELKTVYDAIHGFLAAQPACCESWRAVYPVLTQILSFDAELQDQQDGVFKRLESLCADPCRLTWYVRTRMFIAAFHVSQAPGTPLVTRKLQFEVMQSTVQDVQKSAFTAACPNAGPTRAVSGACRFFNVCADFCVGHFTLDSESLNLHVISELSILYNDVVEFHPGDAQWMFLVVDGAPQSHDQAVEADTVQHWDARCDSRFPAIFSSSMEGLAMGTINVNHRFTIDNVMGNFLLQSVIDFLSKVISTESYTDNSYHPMFVDLVPTRKHCLQ